MPESTAARPPQPVSVAFPEFEHPLLRIRAGACRLHARPGAGHAWVAGTYADPSGQIPLTIDQDPGEVTLRLGRSPADLVGLASGTPLLDLVLGSERPYRLEVTGGAAEVELELGGLPLERFELGHAAATVAIAFRAPNPVPMGLLKLGVGAGRLEASGLASSGAARLEVDAGAARCVLAFDGAMARPMLARLSAGLASCELRVPASLPAELIAERVLGTVAAGPGFTLSAGVYRTRAAAEGAPPLLTLRAAVPLGALRLEELA